MFIAINENGEEISIESLQSLLDLLKDGELNKGSLFKELNGERWTKKHP